MRRSERPCGEQGCILADLPGDRMNFCCLKRLIQTERWQNGGKSFCQHCFPCPWWPDHDHVVSSSCGNLQCPFDIFLTLYIFEIRVVGIEFALKHFACVDHKRLDLQFTFKKINCLPECIYADDVEVIDDRCLAGI